MSARSAIADAPITRARIDVPSCNVTMISKTPSMTWLFVTISPSGVMMNPEPTPWMRRIRGSASGLSLLRGMLSSLMNEMFTTVGRSCGINSISEDPIALAYTGRTATGAQANAAIATTTTRKQNIRMLRDIIGAFQQDHA